MVSEKKPHKTPAQGHQKEHGSTHTLILAVHTPELWDNKFLLFQAAHLYFVKKNP